MLSEFPFSEERLRKLKPPASGRAYYRDSKTPGLQLAVTPAGAKVYYFRRWVGGRQPRVRIARLGEIPLAVARERAIELAAGVAKGENPQAARRVTRDTMTIADLFNRWLAYAKLRKRTWADDVRQFNKYMGPLKGKRLGELSPLDVSEWHRRIAEKHGPYQANRCRALLSSLYGGKKPVPGTAKKLGFAGPNPCEDVPRFPEDSRERYLLRGEIGPFFSALATEPPDWRDFWLLCLYCGARRGNVACMRWVDVNWQEGTWHLSGKRMKAKKPIVVVLSPPAVAVLRWRWQAANGHRGPWVFPAQSVTGHISDPRKSWARVLKASGLSELRPHDLRRTLGSWQAEAGVSEQIIGQSLGHGPGSKATAIYSRLHVDAARRAVEAAVDAMVQAGGTLLLPGPEAKPHA